nr:mitochondrial 37s ribosomal protein s27 [Quercus suber]
MRCWSKASGARLWCRSNAGATPNHICMPFHPCTACADQVSAMAVPRSRILELLKVRSRIFSTIFNPTNQRLGNKVLRQRLRGPALSAYYPRRVATFVDLKKAYPGYEMYDEFEEERLEHLAIAKARGKGAPKKKKTAAGECIKRCWLEVACANPLDFQNRESCKRRNEVFLGFIYKRCISMAFNYHWSRVETVQLNLLTFARAIDIEKNSIRCERFHFNS